MRFILCESQPTWVDAFYEVEIETPSQDKATCRNQVEEAYYDGDYEYLGHTLQDRIEFCEHEIKSIEAMPDGLPYMGCPGGQPRPHPDDVRKLVEVAQAVIKWAQHMGGWEDPCWDSLREALKPFQDNPPSLTPEQQREQDYLASGGSKCPFCKSENIEVTGNHNFDADYATIGCQCYACGKDWTEVYTLTGFTED
jgi:hypothetical protein